LKDVIYIFAVYLPENKDIFTFCTFRTTNTTLPIETGRWNNIARENRKC
jgi:hypothetical protein